MIYLPRQLESHFRKMAEAVRDRIPEDSYRDYGSYCHALALLKRIIDRWEEYLDWQRNNSSRQRESIPSPPLPEVTVPKSVRWSNLTEASRSTGTELRVAERCIREANTGDLVNSLLGLQGSYRYRPVVDSDILRILARYFGSVDLGDKTLKRQRVGPGHSMYDAYDCYIIPTKEATGLFMEHLRITSPRSDQPLWRYMPFNRLKDLVEQRALYFSRADVFDDKFEGIQPGVNMDSGVVGLRREFTFINCWFQGPTESNVMWRSYAPSDGVLIRTSYRHLHDSLCPFEEPVYIGKVKYFNYKTYFSDTRHTGWRPLWDRELGSLSLYFCKRLEFVSENEVRAVVQYPIPDDFEYEPPAERGVLVPVNLGDLIERVIANPQADKRFLISLESLLLKHNLRVGVELSSLAGQPGAGPTRPERIIVEEQE